jgi:NAD(P)-dependent dehydrogenase (short-subunit alcohol dehydrogenase family)
MSTESAVRVALVTGGQQGIGRATAVRLARDGLSVCINDLEITDDLKQVSEQTKGFLVPGDISDPHAVGTIVARVLDEFGRLDVLVCNAAFMTMEPFPPANWTSWWRNLEVNLFGTRDLIGQAEDALFASGCGRVVIIASETGVVGSANATGYGASKAGLIALTRSLAPRYAEHGVTVNAIAPGFVDTPQLHVDAHDAGIELVELHARCGAQVPLGRIGSPDDIASTVSFLADRRSGDITGHVVQPNGGTTRSQV